MYGQRLFGLLGTLLLTLPAVSVAQERGPLDYNDPEFWRIVQAGPASSDELETVVRTYVAHDMRGEAVRAFADYLLRPDKGDDELCAFCQSLLAAHRTPEIGALVEPFYDAADEVLDGLYESGTEGDELIRIAVMTMTAGGHEGIVADRLDADRSLYFLTGAAQLGFTDRMLPDVVQLLTFAGYLSEAQSVAETIFADPNSTHYESETIGQWIRYLEQERTRRRSLGEFIISAVDR